MPLRSARWPAPRPDVALLVLRVVTGLLLLVFFGVPKLRDAFSWMRGSPWLFVAWCRHLGVPAPALVAVLQTLNESVGAFLVAIGFAARPAAASVAVGFAGATVCSLVAREAAWVQAAQYMVAFAAIALAGPGRFSIDSRRARVTLR